MTAKLKKRSQIGDLDEIQAVRFEGFGTSEASRLQGASGFEASAFCGKP